MFKNYKDWTISIQVTLYLKVKGSTTIPFGSRDKVVNYPEAGDALAKI